MAADGRITIDTALDPSGAESGLNQLGGRLEASSKKARAVGMKMSGYLTAPMLAVGAFALKVAGDQETAFAQVSTLLDESAVDFDDYKNAIRKASTEAGIAFEEYSAAVYEAMSSGIDQADAIEFANKMAKLAKGGFTDMATATDIVTTAINAYGLKITDTDAIMDTLINTQDKGKTTVNELANSMGAVIPIAAAQGVSFDQLASGYAILTSNGIKTSEAATYMKAMFGELGKAGSDVDKILREKTGKSFSELQASGKTTGDVLAILKEHADGAGLKLSDLFGSSEAGSSALVLSKDNGDAFNLTLKDMENAAGATDASFAKMNETTGAKTQKAWVSMQNAMAEMGDILLPIVAKIMEFVAGLITKFAELSPTMQLIIGIVALVVAAIGPLLIIIGLIIPAIGVLTTVFTFLIGPIGLTILAVIAVIAILVIAYNKVDWFREMVLAAWEKIKQGTMIAFEVVKKVVMQAVKAVVDFAKVQLDKFKVFWDENGKAIMEIIKLYFGQMKSTIEMIMGIIMGIFQMVWPIILGVVTYVWETIKFVVATAIDIVLGIIRTILKLIQGDWEGAWNSILKIFKDIWENVKSFLKGIDLQQMGKDIMQGLINGIGSMAQAIKDKVKSVVNGVKEAITGIMDMHSPSRVTDGYGVNIMQGLGNGMESMRNAVFAQAKSVANLVSDAFNPKFGELVIPDVPNVPLPIVPSINTGAKFVSGNGSPQQDLPDGLKQRPNEGNGDVYHVTIDAKNVREFNDVVNMAKNLKQTYHSND